MTRMSVLDPGLFCNSQNFNHLKDSPGEITCLRVRSRFRSEIIAVADDNGPIMFAIRSGRRGKLLHGMLDLGHQHFFLDTLLNMTFMALGTVNAFILLSKFSKALSSHSAFTQSRFITCTAELWVIHRFPNSSLELDTTRAPW